MNSTPITPTIIAERLAELPPGDPLRLVLAGRSDVARALRRRDALKLVVQLDGLLRRGEVVRLAAVRAGRSPRSVSRWIARENNSQSTNTERSM